MTDTRANRTRRAAVYARESVDYEVTVDHQIRACVMQAQKDGLDVPDNPAYRFPDNDATGANADRNGFQRLLRIVESGSAGFSRLYVKDRSRFGRFDDIREQFAYEYMLKQKGVEIRYLDEDAINWDDTSGRSLADQLLAFLRTGQTASERHKIRERGRIGKRDAVKDGSYPHVRAPWGAERWHWDRAANRWIQRVESGAGSRKPGLVIGLRWDTHRSHLIREIYELAAEGRALTRIATLLTEREIETPSGGTGWNRNGVARILKNPIYKGDLIWAGKTSKEDPVHHEMAKSHEKYPIFYPGFAPGAPISADLWDRVQRKLAGESVLWERRRANSPGFILSGLLTCATCGKGFHGHARAPKRDGTQLRYYRHHEKRPDRSLPSSDDGCPHTGRYLAAEPLEKAIREACRSLLASPEYRELVQYAVDDRLGQARTRTVSQGISDLRRVRSKLTEEIQRAATRAAEEPDPVVSDAHHRVAKVKAEEKRKVESRIEELKREEETLERVRNSLPEASPAMLEEAFDDLDNERLKQVLRGVVHHAELDPDESHLLLVCRTSYELGTDSDDPGAANGEDAEVDEAQK
jgi:DNA invertase Pin-like site-specific DNA recombinase